MLKSIRKTLLLQPLTRPKTLSFSSSSLHSAPPTQESVLYVLKYLDKKPQKALEFFNHATTNNSFKPNSTSYNLMLRILGSDKNHIQDFWNFLNNMYSQGHSLDHDTYLTLLYKFKNHKMMPEIKSLKEFYTKKLGECDDFKKIRTLCEVVKNTEEGSWEDEGVVKKVEEIGLDLSELNVAKIVREVREYPFKALGFFRWVCGRSEEYKHGSVAYNAMVRVLGRENSVKEFWELAEEMKGEDVILDIDTYIKLLRQFTKDKMMEDAVKLYEFMMDGPFKPAAENCGFLLRQISLTETPDLSLVTRVVNKYEAVGNSLSKNTYDGIHRALCSNGKFDEAEETIKKMREAGFEPDNITYSQLVYGLCKAKQFNEACKLLDKMREEGCVPDLKTWTILIQGHCQAGEIDKALECLTKMIKSDCEADADLLEIMVKGLCDNRRVNCAYNLVNEMVATVRLRPWQATYKYLIEELLKDKKLEEALKMLSLMKSHKYPPYPDPFPSYIAKYGTVEDANEFLKALAVKMYPTHTAYLYVFKSFFDEGRYSEAQDLFFKTPHHIRKHAEIAKLFGPVKVRNAA